MNKNYYDILGISKTSSESDIKKAYRKLAMKYHPDKNKGNKEAEERFKEINEAYGVLFDKKKKQQYDMFGNNQGFNVNSDMNGGFAGFNINDIFGQGFGRSQRTYTYSSGNNKGGINIDDLFGDYFGGRTKSYYSNTNDTKFSKSDNINLDIEKSYEIQFFDFILGGSLEVESPYGEKKKIKIKKGTKPCSKLRVKGFGNRDHLGNIGNLIIKLETKMPKGLTDTVLGLLKKVTEKIFY